MMGTVTLTEFLLARIAEDEERARRWTTTPDAPHRWLDETVPEGFVGVVSASGTKTCITVEEWRERYLEEITPDHRGLAECEVKRHMVRRFIQATEKATEQPMPWRYIAAGIEYALIMHASVYADHPDYRPEWADSGSV